MERIVGGLRNRTLRAVVFTALVFALGLVWVLPAGSQQDPYTSSTVPTTSPPVCRILIEISIGRGSAGIRIVVRARCVRPGAIVTFTFDGQPVGSDAAEAPGQQTGLGTRTVAAVRPDRLVASVANLLRGRGVVAQVGGESPDAVAETVFTVPTTAAVGNHQVCAITAGEPAACTTFQVVATSSRGGGLFARSGLYVLPLVLVGLAAIVIGQSLRSGSRRRRHT